MKGGFEEPLVKNDFDVALVKGGFEVPLVKDDFDVAW